MRSVRGAVRVEIGYQRWWHRFIPKKRKELRTQQLIINHIVSKPEFQRKVRERVIHEIVYGRAK